MLRRQLGPDQIKPFDARHYDDFAHGDYSASAPSLRSEKSGSESPPAPCGGAEPSVGGAPRSLRIPARIACSSGALKSVLPGTGPARPSSGGGSTTAGGRPWPKRRWLF